MSEIASQPEYSPVQMAELLTWVRAQPDAYQSALLAQATDNQLNSQQLAGLIEQQREAMTAPQPAALANPFAGLLANVNISADLLALNAPSGAVQVATLLPAQQRDAGRDDFGGRA